MLALAVVLAASAAAPVAPRFSSSVEVVSLQVTLRDSQGKYVTTVERGAFVVLENGLRQEIVDFSYKPLPIDLTFLLDTSDSMSGNLSEVYKAASQFIQAIQPDTVQIAQFSQVARIVQPSSDDILKVQNELAKLATFADAGYKLKSSMDKMKSTKPEDVIYRETLLEWLRNRSMYGSTSLYEAIYAAGNTLGKLSVEDEGTRRQVIILITDGEDTTSRLTAEDVVKQATQLEIPIYAVCLRIRPLRGDKDGETDNFLTTLSEKSGGEYRIIKNITELGSWYRHIGDELQAQYQIRYTSSDPLRNNQWRTIQVSVGREGYTLHHKQGYYAPCDPDQPCAKQQQR